MRLRRLEPILRRALRGPCALAPGTRLLVAVSGGADSTALLVGLRGLAKESGISLWAAHLHHGLRGAEADADLAAVRALCGALCVPVSAARWNTRLRMRRRGLAGQAGLRVLRREFLLAAARRCGAAAIATAHTADDQLETVLLRLVRGTGLRGLGGMAPRRGPWLKPLLEATRFEVEADLKTAGIGWREDRSNLDPAYARNRIRLEAIPALLGASGGRAARAALARRVGRTAREARGAARLAETWAEQVLSRICRIQGGEITLDSKGWATYPFAFQRTMLRRLWARLAPNGPGLTHQHLEALSVLATRGRGGSRVALPGGWTAERDRGSVRLRRAEPRSGVARAAFPVPGRFEWAGSAVRGRWTSADRALRRLERMRRKPDEEFFAAEALAGPLELREARADECFVPFGRSRPVRLGRFLKKQRVTRDVKSRPTVLADAGGILWVLGVRRSARAPVKGTTRKVLWVHAERHD